MLLSVSQSLSNICSDNKDRSENCTTLLQTHSEVNHSEFYQNANINMVKLAAVYTCGTIKRIISCLIFLESL